MMNLKLVRDRWFYWLLTVELGMYESSAPVAELYRRRLAGDEPPQEEWHAAAADADAAAADAARYAAAAAAARYADAAAARYTAAAAAARYAAAADADAAAAAARYAAAADAARYAAARYAAAAAARAAAARKCIAQALLDLVRAAGLEPAVPNLHALVCTAVGDGSVLDMSQWHCGTSHCRAGWAITVAGVTGADLEAHFGPDLAGCVIYLASTGEIPDFFCGNAEALADIRACAAAEGAG